LPTRSPQVAAPPGAPCGAFRRQALCRSAPRPHGRIIVAGSQFGRCGLARYDLDGVLHASFGDAGILMTSLPTPSCVYATALDETGRVIVAGLATNTGGAGDVALARYLDDGSVDLSFGSAGLVASDLGTRVRT
jgi:hypothetical protein